MNVATAKFAHWETPRILFYDLKRIIIQFSFNATRAEVLGVSVRAMPNVHFFSCPPSLRW